MRRSQSLLVFSVVMGGLFLLAFIMAVLLSGPADFLYSNAAGLSTARQIGQIAAIITGVGLFVTAAIMAVAFAFQPGTFLQHVVRVIPLVTLAMVLMVVVLLLLNIGTVGSLTRIGTAELTLTPFLLLVVIALATIAVAIAGARIPLTTQALRTSGITGGITAVVGAIAAVLMIASVVIISTNEPSASFGRPGGGGPNQGGGNGGNPPQVAAQPTGQGAPNATAEVGQPPAQGGAATPEVAGTPEVGQPPQGGQPPAQGGTPEVGAPTQGGTPNAGGPNQGGGNGNGGNGGRNGGGNQGGGGFPPGGGGPGGNMTDFKGPFTVAGVLAAVFAGLMLIGAGGEVAAMRSAGTTINAASMTVPTVNYGRELGSVIGSFVVVSAVVFVAIQLIPVNKTNPSVVTPVQWDSPQTQALWERACADCHSNETKWPWYSSFAPADWIQVVHINDAREQFNISDTSNIPAFVKSMFANNAKMQMERDTMPPADFKLLHPDARLTDAEKDQLATGLANSLK